MNFFKRLIGRNEVFFDLLEGGAEEAKVSVDDFTQARRKEKRIRHLMTEALGRTFVTPIDREDIEALSSALYRIPKQVERIVERVTIYPGTVPHEMFIRQAELMSQAAGA